MSSTGSRLLLISAMAIAGLIGVGLIWQPHDPHAVNMQHVLVNPSATHWLGTDHLGRDLASRLLVGAQPSLIAIAIVLTSNICIGLLAGALIAFGPFGLSRMTRWCAETALAVPTLIMALLLAALFGAGLVTIALALILSTWAPYALMIAGLFDRLRAEPYWQASMALGADLPGAIRRHMLPNTLPVLGALAGADAGRAVILVASLGFLGLSADTGRPEWGAMINEYRLFLFSEPQLVLAPVLATTLTAFLLNRALDKG